MKSLLIVLALGAATWIPRASGPIDLRWDGGVYYLLGTSLAQGKGYRLLNEPGQIAANQYPPLLPLMIAAHEKVLGTSDMTRVGEALRASGSVLFLVYVYLLFRFFSSRFSSRAALLGTVLSILTLHVYFLSDLAFPELPFSICVLMFLDATTDADSRAGSLRRYAFAVAAFALRTAGIAALAAWVAESVFARRFRQASFRAVLALLPVAAWQVYVASVESSDAYRHPAYAYQRAAYMFYNVSYARNIGLRDPFAPEKGLISPISLAVRFAHNALAIPASLGGTLVSARGYFEMGLHRLLGDTGANAVTPLVAVLLFGAGCLVLASLAWSALHRNLAVPIFVAAYLSTLCLAPFPDQFLRYLMPLAPLLVAAVLCVFRQPGLPRALAGALLAFALIAKTAVAAEVFAFEHQRVAYADPAGTPLSYRLFFYDPSQQDFDGAVDYIRTHAQRGDVVAAGTPHWIYLRTGLTSVMPPYEANPRLAQSLLDTVPVAFLIVGGDVIGSERYTKPVVQAFPDVWTKVFSSPAGYWSVYRRSP